MTNTSYSTAGFNDRNIGEALQAIAASGFAQAEISAQNPHVSRPLMGGELNQFRSLLRNCGIEPTTVHAPMRENVLGAPEEVWRRDKVGVLSDYLRFAASIGASGMVIHPVPNPIFVPEPERGELPQLIADATRRSLDELVPIALEVGVRMLLENLPYHCHFPYLTMGGLRPLVDLYPELAVGLVVDTGHAWTSGNNPAQEILNAGSRLWGTHLQDVDADDPQDNHWVPTHGGLDWSRIREALNAVGYGGSWTFEVIAGRWGEEPEDLAQQTREVFTSWVAAVEEVPHKIP